MPKILGPGHMLHFSLCLLWVHPNDSGTLELVDRETRNLNLISCETVPKAGQSPFKHLSSAQSVLWYIVNGLPD